MDQNVSVAKAARILGKSQQFVRVGLQRQLLPIGIAIKTSTQYSYHISRKKLEEYIGEIQDESQLPKGS